MRVPLLPLCLMLSAAPAVAWQASEPERLAEPTPSARPAIDVRGPAAPGATLVLYDVRDLVANEPDDPLSSRAERGTSSFVRLFDPESGLGDTPAGVAGLAHLIETHLEPPSEQSAAQVLATESGQLMVLAIPEQQQWVAEFLRLQREETRVFLLVTFLYAVPSGSLDELFDGSPDGALVNTGIGQEALRERVLERGGERLSAPVMALEPRQRGALALTSQRSFVIDWSAHRVEPDRRVVLDPRIEVVDEGTLVEARAVTLPGERLGLEVSFTAAEIEEPVPTERVEVHADAPAQEVSRVTQRVRSARTSLVLSGGHVALLIPAGEGGRDMLASLTVDWALASSAPADGPGDPDDEPGARRAR